MASPVCLGDLSDQARLPDVVRQRLLAKDVLASAHGENRHVGMQMIGRGAEHGIDGGLLFQHDAEVLVLRAAEVRRLLGVVLFDLGTHWLAPAAVLVVERLETEIFHRVRDGDHLRVRLVEQRSHVRPPLATSTHQCDVDLVAGRHVAWASQYVWSDNRGGHRGGARSQESSASCCHGIHLVRSGCAGYFHRSDVQRL